ncbi:MAG: sulfotransferase [Halioglobus sp.]
MSSQATHSKDLNDAHTALANEQYERAHALAMAVLKQDPRAADAYFIMALISYRHKNIAKAEDIIQRALGFDADNTDYLLFQAQCLLELNKQEKAKAVVAGLRDKKLKTAHQNDTLGVLHSRLGQHKSALPRFTLACELEPDSVSYRYNLASCLQFSGQFDQAEAAYESAIELDPNNYRSHSSLSQLRKMNSKDNHIGRLKALWPSLGEDSDARLHIGHALAKEHEDLADYGLSFEYLQQAKAKKLEKMEDQSESNHRLFAHLRELPLRLEKASQSNCESDEPIFIVGMPRTGTTLVERILSSHSLVESAGELANFSLLVKRQLQTASNWVLDAETIEASPRLDFTKLGNDYIESTRHLTGDSAHFIDKMPLNFMYAPLIARALPKAKIICLRRNPMDTCLSNYRQLFSTSFSYYNYAYSLKNTAEFYVQFHQLMDHYAATLGESFFQIHYESVVAEPETQTRQLLAHCGLPWEPQCLEFHSNTAPVATASSVQVREKLYTRAVDRWRHYEPWLGELRAVFEANSISYE